MFESVFVIVFSSLGIPRDSHPRFPPRPRHLLSITSARCIEPPPRHCWRSNLCLMKIRAPSSRELARTVCRGCRVFPSRRNSSANSVQIPPLTPAQKRVANITYPPACFDDTLSRMYVAAKCCLLVFVSKYIEFTHAYYAEFY